MKILESHYQKLFQLEEDDFRLKALENLILKNIPEGKKRILDLGCGSALFSCSLAEKGHKVLAVDPSRKMIELARKRKKLKKINNKNLQILKMKAEKIDKLESKFDVVLILDVLEHITNDSQVLVKLKKILDKKGILIITVPAHPFLYGIRDKEMGHFRRYSKKNLINLIKNKGYQIKTIRYWNFIGFLAYLFSEKVANKRIDEKIRYQENENSKKIKRFIFQILNTEKNIKPPIGLTLLLIAQNVPKN